MIIFCLVYAFGVLLLVRRIDNRLRVSQASRERAYRIGAGL